MALINDQTGIYVAYAIHLELLESNTKLKLTIKPPDIEGIKTMRESIWIKKMAERWPNLDRKSYAPSPLPTYPPPSVINLTDQIRLPLWKNDETGAVIGDLISFSLDEPRPTHDFSLNDVMFKMVDFQLRVNGKVSSGNVKMGNFSGSLPWVYLPGKGRFIFSLQPHAGYSFQKNALLEDRKITFRAGGDFCEWISDELILGQRGKWHLWVLLDQDFKGDEQLLRDTQLVSPGNCCLYGAFGDASVLPKPKQ